MATLHTCAEDATPIGMIWMQVNGVPEMLAQETRISNTTCASPTQHTHESRQNY
jgi:hypothetical protein